MIQINGFLCHHGATKTEGNCDEIGHATFSELRRFRTRRFRTKRIDRTPLITLLEQIGKLIRMQITKVT